jgi:hypothetical protein
MTILGLTGFAHGQGHTPDLNKGLVFIYERDLIVTGNVWNVVVSLDLKWYRSQLDYIDAVLKQKSPTSGTPVCKMLRTL